MIPRSETAVLGGVRHDQEVSLMVSSVQLMCCRAVALTILVDTIGPDADLSTSLDQYPVCGQ